MRTITSDRFCKAIPVAAFWKMGAVLELLDSRGRVLVSYPLSKLKDGKQGTAEAQANGRPASYRVLESDGSELQSGPADGLVLDREEIVVGAKVLLQIDVVAGAS